MCPVFLFGSLLLLFLDRKIGKFLKSFLFFLMWIWLFLLLYGEKKTVKYFVDFPEQNLALWLPH